jgi:periplasmic divalent cation tolerance protein
MVPGCVQVSTTLPDENTAQRIGRSLVEERLAACAQVVGPVSSSYWWRGAVEQSPEWYCYLKTTRALFPALSQRLKELHPYDVPEIIAEPGRSEMRRWESGEISRLTNSEHEPGWCATSGTLPAQELQKRSVTAVSRTTIWAILEMRPYT